MRALAGLAATGLLALPLAALGASPAAADDLAPLKSAGATAVNGEYIVVLEDDVTVAEVTGGDGVGVAASDIEHVYDTVLNGFSAELDDAELHRLRAEPGVAYVEEVGEVNLSAVQNNPTWGLDRIDQTNLPLSNSYSYDYTGDGVSVYVIDTGIAPNHPDFGGRASIAFDAYGGNGVDGNGHGTHVAGTVGSATYGVAKEVDLYGVKVLSNSGSGTTAGVIAGVDWVGANADGPSVANLSLGGGASLALDQAVNRLAASDVFVAVAAGNSAAPASGSSPARAAGVTTVAASTRTDTSASYTNYGPSVQLYAPGSAITSTWTGNSTYTGNGTSFASPHVAGAAALYKEANGEAGQSTVQNWLVGNASAGVLSGVPAGTPNLLLNVSGL
ncbi:hypothetical protein Nans01_31230 [Nocardiopsis ansamitocini]|uniref:Peptidase inhibitor I9 n=2 Tax=Nocardiopsis ansamitocini TaxID=1670832 RepID=A0A9W6P856_9ACTN|nr:S8 family peptidase [Nocardiopsis ansamitocini]GLU48772.1 hypothetical protein Nans01_31230 [Nocardiopsis ansamitocini]